MSDILTRFERAVQAATSPNRDLSSYESTMCRPCRGKGQQVDNADRPLNVVGGLLCGQCNGWGVVWKRKEVV